MSDGPEAGREAREPWTLSPSKTVYCRYPILDGSVETVRSELESTIASAADPEHIVGLGDSTATGAIHTLSIFFESIEDRSFLVWHVEGDGGPELVEESPLFGALAEYLDVDARLTIEPATYVAHPERPRAVARQVEEVPFFLGADDQTLEPPDVLVYRIQIRTGLPTWFARRFESVLSWFDGRDSVIERQFERWTEPVIDDEGVHVETAFLQTIDGTCYYVNYLECESRERVLAAYQESDSAIARVSEWVLRWSLADPTILDRIPETPFELLVHGVSEQRP